MEIYIKTDLTLDGLAKRLREILNIPKRNRSPIPIEQERYSLNFGGHYCLFAVLGLDLIRVRNASEVEVPERAEWPYYVMLRIPDLQLADCMIRHLCGVLREAGLEVDLDTLAT